MRHSRFGVAIAKNALALLCVQFLHMPSLAAQGDMGTGVPQFALYSSPLGQYAVVFGIQNATIPFPVGCSYIKLTAATMSIDSLKMSVATMLSAQATNRKVKFYSHAERDGGCGVDYVELILN